MIFRENLSLPTIGHTLHIDFEVKPIKFWVYAWILNFKYLQEKTNKSPSRPTKIDC